MTSSQTTPEELVRVSGLSVGYGDVPVVHHLDLSVNAGEVVALLGPNGAGKTTTLLALSGILRPTAGSVMVLGRQVEWGKGHLTALRGLAHVPEDRALFAQLTVGENIRLGVRSARDAREATTDRVLDLFPALKPLLGRRAGLLSGGEQQMLALARALVGEPRVLVIDEMSMGLAPVIVQNLMPIVRQIADESGVGVLLVEQHVDMALSVADRGYVLSRGALTFEGSAADLEEHRGLLEASYLGDIAS